MTLLNAVKKRAILKAAAKSDRNGPLQINWICAATFGKGAGFDSRDGRFECARALFPTPHG